MVIIPIDELCPWPPAIPATILEPFFSLRLSERKKWLMSKGNIYTDDLTLLKWGFILRGEKISGRNCDYIYVHANV